MPTAARVHKVIESCKRKYDDKSSIARYGFNYRQWRKLRKWHLARNPLCKECLKMDRTVAAKHVDHIEPHRGDPAKFWDRENLQSLCTMHSNQKTGRGQ